MDDVGHERIAGDEPAARQGDCESTKVDAVAPASPPFGEVALKHRFEALLAFTLDGAPLTRERRAGGELAQQLQQR
jgi:hypothetical protein